MDSPEEGDVGQRHKQMVNFRLDPGLVAELDAAAQAAGLSRTEWVVSTLTMVLRRERQPAVAVAAAGHPHVLVDGCAHPRHLRKWDKAGLRCTACRALIETASRGA